MALVVVLFCIPLLVGLGRTDFDNDESIYSFAVDVMLKSGDWLTPKSIPSEDEAWLEKPPLKFWIVAAPIRLGFLPHDEFGLRFWDVVFGSVAFLYVFALGRRFGGPLCGLAAVLVLFVHRPLLFDHGLRSNGMDSAVVLSYCGGAYHFLQWRDGARGRGRGHAFGVALYFVLGFMTKFVAALFLPLVLGAVVLATRAGRLRVRHDWRQWLAPSALAAGLIAPWFLFQFHQFGAEVWHKMVGEHVVTRFTSYLDPNHLRPWHFYFSELYRQLRASQALALTIGGVLLLLARTAWDRSGAAALLVIWAALPLMLISLLSSKLYHYAYPFLPPLAIAAGYLAALVLRFAWWQLRGPATRLDTAFRGAAPAVLGSSAVRAVLLTVAVTAIAIAVATQTTGHLRLALGGTVLLRNSSVLPLWVVGVVALVLAARPGTALRAAAVAVVALWLLPIGAYGQTLAQLPVERHPLRSLRDCLQPIGARYPGPDGRGPGVWAETSNIPHPYSYYLHGLGPFQVRDVASDATVYMHLYVPRAFRPVLLSPARYEQFMQQLSARDPEFVQRAARKAAIEPGTVSRDAGLVAPVFLPSQVLLLPGPYSSCGLGQPRAVSR